MSTCFSRRMGELFFSRNEAANTRGVTRLACPLTKGNVPNRPVPLESEFGWSAVLPKNWQDLRYHVTSKPTKPLRNKRSTARVHWGIRDVIEIDVLQYRRGTLRAGPTR